MAAPLRIGLVADTHVPEAAVDLPEEAYRALAGCDRILHGGDLHHIDVLDRLGRLAPTIASRGNGDPLEPRPGRPGVPDDPRIGDALVVDIGSIRIGLVHDLEHLEDRPEDVVRERLDELFDGPVDVAVCGHTHVPMVWGLAGGTSIVNPGSPTMPYGYRDILGTVGFIDVDGPSFEITILDLATGAPQLRHEGPSVLPCTRGPRPAGGR